MRIAVTGGAGRVGQAVVAAALAEGHTVVEIDRTGLVAGDGDQPGQVRRVADVSDYAELVGAVEGCDALVHLAAHPRPGSEPDHVVHHNNVTSSYNALQVAAQLGIDRVCLASSINAIGGAYSRRASYEYFPVDERHPTYNEDAYSLSKWIAETQAESFARRHERMSIASLRLHGLADQRPKAPPDEAPSAVAIRHLWGYALLPAAAKAFLRALTADFGGHEVFYVVAPQTAVDTPSAQLCRIHYPEVPLRGELTGNQGFFDCAKAQRVLGWRHDPG